MATPLDSQALGTSLSGSCCSQALEQTTEEVLPATEVIKFLAKCSGHTNALVMRLREICWEPKGEACRLQRGIGDLQQASRKLIFQ